MRHTTAIRTAPCAKCQHLVVRGDLVVLEGYRVWHVACAVRSEQRAAA